MLTVTCDGEFYKQGKKYFNKMKRSHLSVILIKTFIFSA